MDYEAGGAADATTLDRLDLVPAAEGQARHSPPSGTDDLEAFSQAISLQAAARAARYAIRPGSIRDRGIEPEERVSLGRAFNLVLAFALGVAVYAGIMYVILGTQLRSPLPSPTPPLPPGATA
jgi:hypothetical protein